MVTESKLIDFIKDKFQVAPDETLVLDTGGTFGAEAYKDVFNPPEFSTMLEDSVIPKVVDYLKEKFGLNSKIKIAKGEKRDSKNYTAKHIEEMVLKIKESGAKNVVIIHGTDSIIENAKAFEYYMEKHDVKANVVFTGAYIPIDNGLEMSDGPENLKVALNFLKKKGTSVDKASVAVALDGRIYENYKEMEKEKLEDTQINRKNNTVYRLVKKNLDKQPNAQVKQDKTTDSALGSGNASTVTR